MLCELNYGTVDYVSSYRSLFDIVFCYVCSVLLFHMILV